MSQAYSSKARRGSNIAEIVAILLVMALVIGGCVGGYIYVQRQSETEVTCGEAIKEWRDVALELGQSIPAAQATIYSAKTDRNLADYAKSAAGKKQINAAANKLAVVQKIDVNKYSSKCVDLETANRIQQSSAEAIAANDALDAEITALKEQMVVSRTKNTAARTDSIVQAAVQRAEATIYDATKGQMAAEFAQDSQGKALLETLRHQLDDVKRFDLKAPIRNRAEAESLDERLKSVSQSVRSLNSATRELEAGVKRFRTEQLRLKREAVLAAEKEAREQERAEQQEQLRQRENDVTQPDDSDLEGDNYQE